MNKSTPVTEDLCSEEWVKGYCAGLRVALARPLEFGAQHQLLGVNDTRGHQTCPGLDDSVPVRTGQTRLPGASNTPAQQARSGLAASINILTTVLEYTIDHSTALKGPAPSESCHGHLGTRTEIGHRESPTHGDDAALSPSLVAVSSAVQPISQEIETCRDSAEHYGTARSPSVAEVPAEEQIQDRGYTTSRASTEFPDIQEVLDRYDRRQTGAGSGAQFRSQPQSHPPEVIDLTQSDDDVHGRPDDTNSKKRSHSDDDDLGQGQRRKRVQQSDSRRSQRLEALLPAYLPVIMMVTIESFVVEFKWNERLGR